MKTVSVCGASGFPISKKPSSVNFSASAPVAVDADDDELSSISTAKSTCSDDAELELNALETDDQPAILPSDHSRSGTHATSNVLIVRIERDFFITAILISHALPRPPLRRSD